MRLLRLAPGYRRLDRAKGSGVAVAHERFAAPIQDILREQTLYGWAEAHPDRQTMQGRGPVYSAPLPGDGPRVVVRHCRRGGLLAPVLRDVYLPPTPAPVELAISFILARAGVPTPPVVAYATYPVGVLLRRVDVMTLEVRGRDLATALSAEESTEGRHALRPAVARLLAALTGAGAWHQDLNARNILVVADAEGGPRAVVLDVDRVRFAPAGDPNVLDANIARLRRSMDKLRGAGQGAFDDADFREIRALVDQAEKLRAAQRESALQEHRT